MAQPIHELHPGTGAGRVPPQNLEAEKSLLGAMLLSRDAIGEAAEITKADDFYKPLHGRIFEAIVTLFVDGEPVDAVTLAEALRQQGTLDELGGVSYLRTLTQEVPATTNAEYYAQIVAEVATLRRLINCAGDIAERAYLPSAESREVLDFAEGTVFDLSHERETTDLQPMVSLLDESLRQLEQLEAQGGGITGLATGFTEFDKLTAGLHPSNLVIVAARPGMGKALALDTELPTPTGWTAMGDVEVGDELIGADGAPTRVTAVSEIRHGRPCFEMIFSDGTVIVADADHQWVTQKRSDSRADTSSAVRTTREIASTLLHSSYDRQANHSVPVTAPFDMPVVDLLIDPYVLGVWLADGVGGAGRIASDDPEVIAGIESAGHTLTRRETSSPSHDESELARHLRALGVLDDRHIPAVYLRAGEDQRRGLLAGLLDARGSLAAGGRSIRFETDNRHLARGVRELVLTLGYRVSMSAVRRPAHESESLTGYKVEFAPREKVFRVTHKLSRQSLDGRRDARVQRRHITDVRPIESVPVRCVQVDNSDHMYLASRSCIPTHNSTFIANIASHIAIEERKAVAFFTLEMSAMEVVNRVICSEGGVEANKLKTGRLGDQDWAKVAQAVGVLSKAPLYIDDSAQTTVLDVRSKCRRLKQHHDLGLIVVDYVQLMHGTRDSESRQVEVSEISRGLKILARDLDTPVIAACQLNRSPEGRADKRPLLGDLRESGCLTADTRVLRADNGVPETLGDLLARGERDFDVWSVDARGRLVSARMSHVFPSGTKPVFELVLVSGRRVNASANHPFRMATGWVPLEDLAVGDRIAIPHRVAEPLEATSLPDDEVVLLAHLLGAASNGGSGFSSPTPRYTTPHLDNAEAVEKAATHFGVTARREVDEIDTCGTIDVHFEPSVSLPGERNPIGAWLAQIGLLGRRPDEVFIPDAVFGLGRHQVGLFLRHLWATNGLMAFQSDHDRMPAASISLTTASRRMADNVADLLLRFGIVARIVTLQNEGALDTFEVCVERAREQLCFMREIGCHGTRGQRPEFVEHLLCTADSESTTATAIADVFWDEICDIRHVGDEPTFDATVLETHNFIANGITVHNSLEQDSDIVSFLYRDDYYNPDSTALGEAELIVAKHRNGPTGTIPLAFVEHHSRFRNLTRDTPEL